jgi:hypothetical protein
MASFHADLGRWRELFVRCCNEARDGGTCNAKSVRRWRDKRRAMAGRRPERRQPVSLRLSEFIFYRAAE